MALALTPLAARTVPWWCRRSCSLIGRLALPEWTNKRGEPRGEVVVVATSIHYLDRKADAQDVRDARAPVA
jgi:hypothetical protein